MIPLALVSLLLAAVPALLVLRNLRIFPPLPRCPGSAEAVSILIPARDEEANISAAIEAALGNSGAEILVLDDNSSDATAELVRQAAAQDSRLRLLSGAELPTGWAGKNWACWQLARAATRPLLLFVDADVRLAPDAAPTIAQWMRRENLQFASGIPFQQLGTFAEQLLLPLIHFVLLGFLPLHRMRASRSPAYATACGQLMMIEKEAYQRCGGHSAIRDRLHEGLALPKVFRQAGYRTDLLDGTDLATCRMYHNAGEVWQGLAKNAHEGLGAPGRILPATLVLALGQIAPFILLALTHWVAPLVSLCGAIGSALVLSTRIALAKRFRQPITTALLHPLAVAALLDVQWTGFARWIFRRPARWKSREYAPASAGDGVTSADSGEHLPERI